MSSVHDHFSYSNYMTRALLRSEYIVNAQHKVINDIRYDKGNNYLSGVTSLKVVYPTAFLSFA